ncbi:MULTISPECIES: NfeD family protein [unclassified Caballeronia]|uniref:NfeD family protein n=1 Tax=unclassified Caballeronia TaxID=2646786 RepID=UPI002855B5D5|nr:MULTISPECIES: NfeD family protein [unclassified Caballeronia]MDR5750470.1 NfeD family protein [Caballeronia sp. LZ024]MDR5842497.1 NfeD family protein [Caballeronia sp. LZ031]
MASSGLFWWIVAGALVVMELFTGTFYLLMIALGFIAGGLAHWFGATLDVELAAAAGVALVAVVVLRRSRFGNWKKRDASRDVNVNLDIGETLQVNEWHEGHARAMYRGAQWDIELAPGETEGAGWYRITAMQGNRLVVAAKRG